MAADQILRDDLRRIRRNRHLIEVDVLEAELLGQSFSQRLFVNQTLLKQDLA